MKEKKKKTKNYKGTKPSKTLDFDSLANALVGDKLVEDAENKWFLLKRKRHDGELVTVCKLLKTSDDFVSLWDETLQQCFSFVPSKDKVELKVYVK